MSLLNLDSRSPPLLPRSLEVSLERDLPEYSTFLLLLYFDGERDLDLDLDLDFDLLSWFLEGDRDLDFGLRSS